MYNVKKYAAFSVCLLLALLIGVPANAQESHAKDLAGYMTSDVVGVFYTDVSKLELDVMIQYATQLGFREQGELTDLTEALSVYKSKIERLKKAGISRAYALLRTTDLQTQRTAWVMPLKPGSDPVAAKKVFQEIVPVLMPHLFAEVEATDDALLGSATKAQMDRLKSDEGRDKTGRQPVWSALGDGAFGILLFGDEDSRRVVSELLPNLPAPFESITGQLVAEELDWAGIELRLGTKPNLKVVVEASNEVAAKLIEETIVEGFKFLQALPETKQYIPEKESAYVFDSLKPNRAGNRVSVSTEKLTADMSRLASVLAPQVKMVRVAAASSGRMNNLRQLALGILNFESANRHFPTQGTIDEKGNQLLSWRVQVLPFIGQSDLYDQFQLDEPWDSEHNMKLIGQMPDVYKDTNPESLQNNKAGKTIIQGAAGEKMVFHGNKEIGFSELTDGSNNTILLATVARKHAVPWTKPADWEVNLENPTAQLLEDNRTEVEVAIADGSTHRIPISTELVTWQRLIQMADGEIVSW